MISDHPRYALTTQTRPVLEAVPVTPDYTLAMTPEQRDELVIDVIHDGDYIPAQFLEDLHGQPITFEQLHQDYVRERDWGACLIAERVASKLGLTTYTRVNVARVLMDFGRFPGSTIQGAEHLDRFAINYPFSELLSISAKRQVLEQCYDEISALMEPQVRNKRLKIAIHTYDRLNRSGTERPATSILTRTLSYQNHSRMAAGIFDPLFPDILAEFTSDRILRDRLSLMLEKSGIPVSHNYPYLLPEGSLEVRYQVWVYFHTLRQFFERHYPESADDPAFELVWKMLMDTNLRSSESDTLRSYIHMYRRAPRGQETEFERASAAYAQLRAFSSDQGGHFTEQYRFSPERASSLGLEVRKDLLVELDEHGTPGKVRWDNVERISDVIAQAVAIYMSKDRPAHAQMPQDLARVGDWRHYD